MPKPKLTLADRLQRAAESNAGLRLSAADVQQLRTLYQPAQLRLWQLLPEQELREIDAALAARHGCSRLDKIRGLLLEVAALHRMRRSDEDVRLGELEAIAMMWRERAMVAEAELARSQAEVQRISQIAGRAIIERENLRLEREALRGGVAVLHSPRNEDHAGRSDA